MMNSSSLAPSFYRQATAGAAADADGREPNRHPVIPFRRPSCAMPYTLLPGTLLRRAAGLALALVILGGCGTLPERGEPPASEARPAAPAESPLARIAQNSMPAPELTGFRLMPLGVYSLDARLQLADRATQTLDVQYYHIHDDLTGRLFLRHLRDASLRGVRVRLLVDDLYTFGADELFRSFAAFPNVEVRLFNPFCCLRESLVGKFAGSLLDFRRVNRRMHNKLFIADGAMSVMGGRNIADEYFMRSTSGNFVDMDVFIVGAVVRQLASIFDVYWNAPQVYPIEKIVESGADDAALRHRFGQMVDEGYQMMKLELPHNDVLGYGAISEDLDDGRVGLVWGTAVAFAEPPAKAHEDSDERARAASVRMNVMDNVARAERDVYLTSPYLIPGERGMAVFEELGRRNVKMTILTNSLAATDEPLVHTGYSRYRAPMLRAGVDLYELSPVRIKTNKRLGFGGSSLGRLHAKTVVIDRHFVFIGSMNLDPRSEGRNTELGIIAENPQLAKEVIRVVHISKLQGAYRVRFGPEGQGLQWLTMNDDAEVILDYEPDSTFAMRLQNVLFAPFVPEQEL
jgi:putative cardiolipin synthase